MTRTAFPRALLASCYVLAFSPLAHAQSASTSASPWPAGDELGMANTLGPATWKRCAPFLADPKAKSYELSYLRSKHHAAVAVRYAAGRQVTGRPSAFRARCTPSTRGDGERRARRPGHADGRDRPFRCAPGEVGRQRRISLRQSEILRRSYTQKGCEAQTGLAAAEARHREGAADRDHRVLLDAKIASRQGKRWSRCPRHREGHRSDDSRRMGSASAAYKPAMCSTSYTGWGDNWKDPDTEKFYYTKGPGLAYDAAKLIEQKKVVLVALDNPFTDPVARRLPAGQGRAAGGHAGRPAVRDPSLQSAALRHPSDFRTPTSARLAKDKAGCRAPDCSDGSRTAGRPACPPAARPCPAGSRRPPDGNGCASATSTTFFCSISFAAS